ncbi:hypothetical protein Hanom_Chr16g01427721 [Helianthus anomalus]
MGSSVGYLHYTSLHKMLCPSPPISCYAIHDVSHFTLFKYPRRLGNDRSSLF